MTDTDEMQSEEVSWEDEPLPEVSPPPAEPGQNGMQGEDGLDGENANPEEIQELRRLVLDNFNRLREIDGILVHLWPLREKDTDLLAALGAQLVELTSSGSSPSFTYAFVDRDNQPFTGIAPVNADDRIDAKILAVGWGEWFPDGKGSGNLYLIEPPDLASCTTPSPSAESDARMMGWMGF